jgi:hypothetical protein
MGIEMQEKKPETVVFDTPEGIELYRLASCKARIKLEMTGLRAKGRATKVMIAAELGLKPRDSAQKFLDELQRRIDALKAKILRDRLVVEERGSDWMVMSCDRSAFVMHNLEIVHEDIYKVFFYAAGKEGDAKEQIEFKSATEALDAAEDWVLEVR